MPRKKKSPGLAKVRALLQVFGLEMREPASAASKPEGELERARRAAQEAEDLL